MTQSTINNSSSTFQPLNSENRPSKSLPNPWGCIPTFFRCKGRKDTLSQSRTNQWRSIPTLIHQERKKDSRLSQPLPNQWRSIPTLFRCANQKEREDALLYEEDDESLTQEGMHECLEEVEEENKYQDAEDVDQEVEDKEKEQKGVESVHFASSEATPPKLPSEFHFKWANPYDMNCLGPQRYGLIETDELRVPNGSEGKERVKLVMLSADTPASIVAVPYSTRFSTVITGTTALGPGDSRIDPDCPGDSGYSRESWAGSLTPMQHLHVCEFELGIVGPLPHS
ncbi:hypothetical protein PIB30_023395 [Stylosanthes scabra]|uniref:Uncharacterized protein n=1 Tax=Stylosanthes scabra TaxID=79078 RepID=A0ABU6W9K0_9FABA|nr:hypothetical protein [Stylosanthes scabra]